MDEVEDKQEAKAAEEKRIASENAAEDKRVADEKAAAEKLAAELQDAADEATALALKEKAEQEAV